MTDEQPVDPAVPPPEEVDPTDAPAKPTEGEPAPVHATLLPSFEETEIGLVRRFWIENRTRYRYVYEEGLFLVWDGLVWSRDTKGALRRAISDYLTTVVQDDILSVQKRLAAEGDDDDDKGLEGLLRRLYLWKRWAGSERGIRDGLKLFASLPEVTVHETELDAKGFLLTLQNGTYDLVDGRLRQPDPKDLITRVLPFAYDATARAPGFFRFLGEVQPDSSVREYLQRIAGRCLIRNPERRRLIIHYGVGGNGKSVYLNVLGALLEPYVVTADVQTLLERRTDRIENDLARMAGARLVVVRELPEGRRFDESLVKALTGGEKVSARFLRCEYFEYLPGFQIQIMTNAHPTLNDSPAMTDRIVVVPWPIRIEPERRDRGLIARLVRELPGVFNWAVEGLRNWRMSELNPPSVVAKYTSMVEAEALPFSAFVEQVLDQIGDDRFVPVDWVLACATEWSRRYNLRPMTAIGLGRALGEAGIERERFGASNVGGYRGYAIKPGWVAVVKEHVGRNPTRNGPAPKDLDLDVGSMPDPRRVKEVSRDVF